MIYLCIKFVWFFNNYIVMYKVNLTNSIMQCKYAFVKHNNMNIYYSFLFINNSYFLYI